MWNSKVVKLTLTRAHLVWYTILRTSATGLGTVTTGECVDGLCGGPEAMSWPDDEWGEGGEELSPSMMLKAALPGKTKHKIVWNLTNLSLMPKGKVFWIIQRALRQAHIPFASFAWSLAQENVYKKKKNKKTTKRKGKKKNNKKIKQLQRRFPPPICSTNCDKAVSV